MRRVLIAFGLLILCAGLWFALSEGPARYGVAPESSGPAAVPDARNPSEAHDAPAGGGATPYRSEVTAPDSLEPDLEPGPLTIRSSSGLPLPFVEWRSADSDWLRVELDEAGRPSSAPDLPCELRAPGHLTVSVKAGVTQVLLEPDAMFTLRAPDLRTCTRSIAVDDPYLLDSDVGTAADHRRAEVCVSGFVSDSEWVVALSPGAVRSQLNDEQLRIVVHWSDERRADALFDARPGARGHWDVPCDLFVAGAPLRVEIERVQGDERGELLVGIIRPTSGPSRSTRESFDWGTVLYYPLERLDLRRRLVPDANVLDFAFVPTGVPLSLAAQDPASRAYGQLSFVHDGQDRHLVLTPGVRVTGRLIDGRDGSPLSRASVVWECRVDGEGVWGWRAEGLDLELSVQGEFELRGPKDMPLRSEVDPDPPGMLCLRVEAPGFDPLEVERLNGTAREIDFGDLRLVARTPALVLAPGHGVSPESVAWMDFQVAGRPDENWGIRWGRPAADGSLELHLNEDEIEDMQDPEHPKPGWGEPSALILYVNDDDTGPVRAFERDPDRRYRAVEQRRFEFEFMVEPSATAKNWWIGWEWNGLFAVCEGFSNPIAGDPLRTVFSVPVEGARLAWVGVEGGTRGNHPPSDLVTLSDAMPVLALR